MSPNLTIGSRIGFSSYRVQCWVTPALKQLWTPSISSRYAEYDMFQQFEVDCVLSFVGSGFKEWIFKPGNPHWHFKIKPVVTVSDLYIEINIKPLQFTTNMFCSLLVCRSQFTDLICRGTESIQWLKNMMMPPKIDLKYFETVYSLIKEKRLCLETAELDKGTKMNSIMSFCISSFGSLLKTCLKCKSKDGTLVLRKV